MMNPCPIVIDKGLTTDAQCRAFADGAVFQVY